MCKYLKMNDKIAKFEGVKKRNAMHFFKNGFKKIIKKFFLSTGCAKKEKQGAFFKRYFKWFREYKTGVVSALKTLR